MTNFKEIEDKVVTAAKDILHEAEANEPTIGAAVRSVLDGAGVPAPLATAAVSLVEGLMAHFTADHATTPVEVSPEPVPSAPVAEPSAAPIPSDPVPSEPEAAATADPFAPVTATNG